MPAKGWFFGWHRQAFDLVTRSPVPLAVASAFVLCAGRAEVLIVRLFPDLMAVIVVMSLFMVHLISLFSFWISLPGLTFILIWTYVGAREIFGGINENGMRQTARKAA